MSDKKNQKTKDKRQRTKDKSAIRNPQSAIVLVGFMGSGKTTVAKVLAEKLDCDFVDLDSFIESREGRSIASIIDEKGEASFRGIETKALRDVFEENRARIIAPGGGAWMIEENRKLISEYDCLTVWLDAPFELCWERIKTESDTRPFARDKEKARRLYDSRKDIYGLSQICIEVFQEMSVEEIADKIIDEMKSDKRKK
jgi:shikimate kinase